MPRKASGQSTPNAAGEPWQRLVHVLVGRFEGLAVEEAQDEKGRDGRGGGDTQRAATSVRAAGHRERRTRSRSASRREAARPTGPTAPPIRGRAAPRAAPGGRTPHTAPRRAKVVRRTRVRKQHPADRVTGSAHRHEQPDPGRREHHERPRTPTATQALRASPPARSAPSRTRRAPRRRPREPRATGRTCPRDHRLTEAASPQQRWHLSGFGGSPDAARAAGCLRSET